MVTKSAAVAGTREKKSKHANLPDGLNYDYDDETVAQADALNKLQVKPGKDDPEDVTTRQLLYTQAGPVVRSLVAAMYASVKAAVVPVLESVGLEWRQIDVGLLKASIREDVKALDDAFGWDFPPSETEEDLFYDTITNAELEELLVQDPDAA